MYKPICMNTKEKRGLSGAPGYESLAENVTVLKPSLHLLSVTMCCLQVDSVGRGCWVLRRQSYEIMKTLREFSLGAAENNARFLLCILKQ